MIIDEEREGKLVKQRAASIFFPRIMSRFQPVNHSVFSRVELSFLSSSSTSSSMPMPFSFFFFSSCPFSRKKDDVNERSANIMATRERERKRKNMSKGLKVYASLPIREAVAMLNKFRISGEYSMILLRFLFWISIECLSVCLVPIDCWSSHKMFLFSFESRQDKRREWKQMDLWYL